MTPVEPLEGREWAVIGGYGELYRFTFLMSLSKCPSPDSHNETTLSRRWGDTRIGKRLPLQGGSSNNRVGLRKQYLIYIFWLSRDAKDRAYRSGRPCYEEVNQDTHKRQL